MIDVFDDFGCQKAGTLHRGVRLPPGSEFSQRLRARVYPARLPPMKASSTSTKPRSRYGSSQIAHGGSKFAQYPLCATPGDTDHVRQSSGRNATFVRTHQIDGGKPFGQGQFGVFKDGAGGDRGLMVTLGTLMQEMTGQNVSLVVAATRAHKAVRPAMTFEFFQAGLLG